MDDITQNENSSGLSKEEESLIGGETSKINFQGSMPTEEISIEPPTPKKVASSEVTHESIDKKVDKKPEEIKLSEISKDVADKTFVSQRFSGSRFNSVFYVFLGVSIVFYTLSVWIIMASLSLCHLPEGFRQIVLSFGKLLS